MPLLRLELVANSLQRRLDLVELSGLEDDRARECKGRDEFEVLFKRGIPILQ